MNEMNEGWITRAARVRGRRSRNTFGISVGRFIINSTEGVKKQTKIKSF